MPSGDPVYWDENSGPSMAQQNTLGTIPSESFSILGGTTTTAIPCFDDQQPGFKVIQNFSPSEARPWSGVIVDKSANLYGTSANNGVGIAYKLSEKGAGWVLNLLASLTGQGEGNESSPLIVGPNDALYGSAPKGGLPNCFDQGCGVIFSLRPPPNACAAVQCDWTETILYEFTGGTDAANGGVGGFDHEGNLDGGSGGGIYGEGTIYELSPATGGWAEKVLYNFTGGADGGFPTSLFVGKNGNLYGATAAGGLYNGGVLFELTPSAGGWNLYVLGNFQPFGDFGFPPALLAQDSYGNLFGVNYLTFDVYQGVETDAYGFMLSSYNNKVTQIFTLTPGGDYNDYVYVGGLGVDSSGNLYGTSYAWCWDCGLGGLPLNGHVFELKHETWAWVYQDLVTFYHEDFPASGALAIDAQGDVYGTTWHCGTSAYGTAWEYSP